MRPDVCSLSLRALQIASMLLPYRAANASLLFLTSSTIGSFFKIITSEFLGRAENRTYPAFGFNNMSDECFCFGIVDMFKVPSEKVVNPLVADD